MRGLRTVCACLIISVFLSGCFFNWREELPDPGLEMEVPIGIPGYEENIPLERYTNESFEMWVDASLNQNEEDGRTLFFNETRGVVFSIEAPQENVTEWLDNIEVELLSSGYGLYNHVELNSSSGEGFIYYSTEREELIEVYVLEAPDELPLLVRWVIPKDEMDMYTPRFQYMLESMQRTG